MAKEFTAPSGAKCVIEDATFADACELHALIANELLKLDISFEVLIKNTIAKIYATKKGEENFAIEKITFADIMAVDGVLETISRVSLALLSSEQVRKKIFKCLERSLYNSEVIRESLFNEPEKRKDYYSIFRECIKTNVFCFIQGLY